MKKSLPQLEKLSCSLESHYSYFTFNKQEVDLTEKYRKGRISAALWLNELIYYYIEKEKNFVNEFRQHIEEQKVKLSELRDGDYKQGLYDELNFIEEMLDDISTKR